MTIRPIQCGSWAILALVVLRLVIGWHFFKEGSTKISRGDFSSAGFFSRATGPFAGFFHGLVSDVKPLEWLDHQSTIDRWDRYRHELAAHFGFDDRQVDQADKIFENRVRQLREYYSEHEDAMAAYKNGMAAIERAKQDLATSSLPSLRAHVARNRAELRSEEAEWVERLRGYGQTFAFELHALCDEQQRAHGEYPIEASRIGWLSSTAVDAVVPYFDLTVGALLVVGLFVRPAAMLGALFLLSVVATQPPWVAESTGTYYECIEMASMLVLAAVGAGRFAGLDVFLSRRGRGEQRRDPQQTN